MQREKSKRKASTPAPAKRPPGRPRRPEDLERIAVYIPGELKRWLQHQAIDTGQDMGRLVAGALQAMRARMR
jgi:hypothetical protein